MWSEMRNADDGEWVRYDDVADLELQLAEVRAENERLRAWQESAMAVEAEWDAQAIAKMLGARPGQSCRQVVAEKVPQLVVRCAKGGSKCPT